MAKCHLNGVAILRSVVAGVTQGYALPVAAGL